MTIAFKDLGQALINLQPAFAAVKDQLIPALALLFGSFFIFQAFIRMTKIGEGRGDVTPTQVLTGFFVGGFAIQYAKTVSIASNMVALNGGLSYTPHTGSAYTDQVVSAVVFIVSVIGAYSIFAALLDAKKAGDGDNSGGGDLVSRALWKFVGGAVAMNLGSLL